MGYSHLEYIMSVTFSIQGLGYYAGQEGDEYHNYVNLSGMNARVLLTRLGLDPGEVLMGDLRARDLAERCKTELTTEKMDLDGGEEGFTEGRYRFFGRSPGLINKRIQELLDLCSQAGDLGVVTWS